MQVNRRNGSDSRVVRVATNLLAFGVAAALAVLGLTDVLPSAVSLSIVWVPLALLTVLNVNWARGHSVADLRARIGGDRKD